MPAPKAPKAPDHQFIVILRHTDGGVALRDSGDDLDDLREKCVAEWARAEKRLGAAKAGTMTMTTYRRTSVERSRPRG